MTRPGEDIGTMIDSKGKQWFIIYSKGGVLHLMNQHLDALNAIKTGVYFATKPVVDKKIKKRVK